MKKTIKFVSEEELTKRLKRAQDKTLDNFLIKVCIRAGIIWAILEIFFQLSK